MTKKYKGPNILTTDIETLPLTAYNWSLWDETRSIDKVEKDWSIFSVAAKWMHDKKVMYQDTQAKPVIYDDKELLEWTCGLLDEADIVIGQNVERFDLKKIRARAIYHGLKPFKEPEVIDTLVMAKEVAKFTSNKLEYLSALPGVTVRKSTHAKFPGFLLWLECMKGNPAAWKEVRNYNIDDVRATEQLYMLLRPWVRKHPNLSHYYEDDTSRCPRCGCPTLVEEGDVRRGLSIYKGYVCTECGGHSRARYNTHSRAKRQAMLTCR